jgi:DNA-binding MarR family transcriptional regulator
MNQKVVGTVLVIAGIIITIFVFMAKAKEDAFIQAYVDKTGSCYLDNGTCLHEGRDYSLYIGGWILSASLIILGIYLLAFDKTQELMLKHHERIAGDLKEAKEIHEWDAFLAGFSGDEQKVLKAIKEQDGIKQSTLRYKAGISKTGLSLMLKNLEEKDIITRKESGKTNEVYLRKKF